VALARRDGPTALVLSRQALPVLPRRPPGWLALRGARVVRNGNDRADVVLVATGSEVSLSLAAADRLAERGVVAWVVSMPWRERFEALPPEDREVLVPPDAPRLVVEAASPQGWQGVAGERGRILGLARFGASAPGGVALAELGFSPESVAAAAFELLGRGAGT
jgi:transketolase